MRYLLLFLITGSTVFAADVLPTATVCDLFLRSARRAPRAIAVEGTDQLRAMVKLATTDQVFRRRTLTDVRFDPSVQDGLLILRDPAPEAFGTVVAREFIGEEEIAAALEHFHRDQISIGDRVSKELARRFPRARPTEIARLALEVASAALPTTFGLGHTLDLAGVPIAFATVFHNDRRRVRQREERFGVPGLDRQLRILARSLRETPQSRAEGHHRALSIVRGTVRVTPEVHRALIDGRAPTTEDIDRLVDSAAPMRADWLDHVATEPPSFELSIESAVFSEPNPRDCRLRWMIFFRARRIEPPSDGLIRVEPDRLRPLARVARP